MHLAIIMQMIHFTKWVRLHEARDIKMAARRHPY